MNLMSDDGWKVSTFQTRKHLFDVIVVCIVFQSKMIRGHIRICLPRSIDGMAIIRPPCDDHPNPKEWPNETKMVQSLMERWIFGHVMDCVFGVDRLFDFTAGRRFPIGRIHLLGIFRSDGADGNLLFMATSVDFKAVSKRQDHRWNR